MKKLKLKNLKDPVFTGYFPKDVPKNWDIYTDDITDTANGLEVTITYGHAAVFNDPNYSQPFGGEMVNYNVAVLKVWFSTPDGDEIEMESPDFYTKEIEKYLTNMNFGK